MIHRTWSIAWVLIWVCLSLPAWALAPDPQADDPAPPTAPVKLIFVHHSTGGNWLADANPDQPYGELGIALRDNNYYVSATNYGWGPDGIGDRTDIVNWPEWFTGPNSAAYLEALYQEQGQNEGDFGAWSRLESDPGGENQIIMFKSCFPNSDLEGSPDDPPLAEANDWEYSVANAKAVYLNLLTYFQTRPDRLFVLITAPPLMAADTTPGRAANARALNNWLVNEWLQGYEGTNVAVFDYYNVLTAPENHHRWSDGRIEHVQPAASNVSAYPSGDSHPSTDGHRKATADLVPLLNVYYHRWQQALEEQPAPTATVEQAVEATSTSTAEGETSPTATAESGTPVPVAAEVIESWESENVWLSNGDDAQSTVTSEVDRAVAHEGGASLRISYQITAEGWGDSGTSFERPRDWSGADGLSLWLRADQAGQPLIVVLFSGPADHPTAFQAEFETNAASLENWSEYVFTWGSFVLAPWDDGSGLQTLDPARIVGLALNFTPGEGTLWVDDVGLFEGFRPPVQPDVPTATPAPAEEQAPTPTAAVEPAQPTETPEPAGRGGLCASTGALIVLLALGAWLYGRRS